MRHDMFIGFELWNGRTVFVNPDAVTEVVEAVPPADGDESLAKCQLHTCSGSGNIYALKNTAEVVIGVITQAREKVQGDKAEDAEEPG